MNVLHIRRLTTGDIAAALRLSAQAGWNQIDADWRRLIALWPDRCFAGEVDGHLIATATAASFAGDVTWIGMVLVDEACRGRGVGGQMLRHVIDVLQPTGSAVHARDEADANYAGPVLGLDATDLGRPLYGKLGFVDHRRINRWVGPTDVSMSGAASCNASPLTDADWPDVLAFDRRAAGADRAALLQHLADEPGATARIALDAGRVAGFGLSRRGREHAFVGPVVADTTDAATRLTDTLLTDRRADGQSTALVDVPEGVALESPLREAGFTVQRRLTRMTRPAVSQPVLCGAGVHLGAGFELG